jgi:hypothetical protein
VFIICVAGVRGQVDEVLEEREHVLGIGRKVQRPPTAYLTEERARAYVQRRVALGRSPALTNQEAKD